MTPLRKRFIEDMQLRGLAPTTQRSYLHYLEDYAKFFKASPEKLDLEAVRQYEIYMLQERKLSPETINGFVSSAQFLCLTTLEMPWGKENFPVCVSAARFRWCWTRRKLPGSSTSFPA
jgi:site-specific recombinase XerD